MPKSKNVVIRVTPKQAERWRRAAALADAEHYTSWARDQVDAAVRRSRRNPAPGRNRDPEPQEPGPQDHKEAGAGGGEHGPDKTPETGRTHGTGFLGKAIMRHIKVFQWVQKSLGVWKET